MFFINTFFWLWLFIIPAGGLGFLAFWLYAKSPDNLVYSIISSVVGVALGIVIAEYIRKRYGLDNFFGRLLATPDIDGGNILDEMDAKHEEEKKKRAEKKKKKDKI